MIRGHMAERVRLRPAEAGDAELIGDIFLAARLRHLSFVPLVRDIGEVRAWIREVLVPGGGVMVAAVHGRPVGFVAISAEDGIGWINHLYVHPACANCGIGTKLLSEALARLPHPVRLYTFQQNRRAQHFYEKHGFTAVEFTDGSGNEERCPDILYELAVPVAAVA